jgi:tetratricopeptide (TPR) repeat protein
LDPDLAEVQARRFAFAPERNAYHRLQLARILFDTGRVEEGWQVLQPTRDPAVFEGSRVWEILGAIELARGHLLRGDTDSARELATASLEEQVLSGKFPHVVAALIAQLERRAGNLGAALAVLDRAVALAPGPVELPAATLLWRRALVHHALGEPARARADLDVARPVLAGLPLRLLELLGCLATEALVTTDPAREALLLGCIDAHRKSWVLPQDLDEDLAPLRAQLALTQPDDLAAGRSLAPHLAAELASTA